MDEFDRTDLGQFGEMIEHEIGEEIPLQDLKDFASRQVEIEDSFLPENLRETRKDRAKRILSNLLKRPRLDENELLRLQRLKEWAKRNLFVISGVAIVVASAITAVVLVMKRALRSSSRALGKQSKIDPNSSPVAPFYNWLLENGEKPLTFTSRNLFVVALAMVLSFLLLEKLI